MAVSSLGYSPAGRATPSSKKSLSTGSVQGKPSTSGRGKYFTRGTGGGHTGRSRPGGGTGGRGGKSASYAIPGNKLR